jgi:hypothetical protein
MATGLIELRDEFDGFLRQEVGAGSGVETLRM